MTCREVVHAGILKSLHIIGNGADGDRIDAPPDPFDDLPPIARDFRVLIDIELFDVVHAERAGKEYSHVGARAGDPRIVDRDFAVVFGLQQIMPSVQRFGLDRVLVDKHPTAHRLRSEEHIGAGAIDELKLAIDPLRRICCPRQHKTRHDRLEIAGERQRQAVRAHEHDIHRHLAGFVLARSSGKKIAAEEVEILHVDAGVALEGGLYRRAHLDRTGNDELSFGARRGPALSAIRPGARLPIIIGTRCERRRSSPWRRQGHRPAIFLRALILRASTDRAADPSASPPRASLPP